MTCLRRFGLDIDRYLRRIPHYKKCMPHVAKTNLRCTECEAAELDGRPTGYPSADSLRQSSRSNLPGTIGNAPMAYST